MRTMRRYIRADTPAATYFFTLTLQERSARHLVDHIAELRSCLAAVKARHPFRIDAMVVLPEHLHALWTLPADDADFSTRWMLLKQSFTRRLHASGALDDAAQRRRGQRSERNIWQRRFWEHRIRDAEDHARHVDYIHFNPVKHGWVLRARDWPYSSLHSYVRAGRLAEGLGNQRGDCGGVWGVSMTGCGEHPAFAAHRNPPKPPPTRGGHLPPPNAMTQAPAALLEWPFGFASSHVH
jgi:putative transposase